MCNTRSYNNFYKYTFDIRQVKHNCISHQTDMIDNMHETTTETIPCVDNNYFPHSAKGGAVETGCSDLYDVIY